MTFVKVGKIADAHNLNGEIKVRFISEEPIWIDKLNQIYISVINDLEPVEEKDLNAYEITNIRFTNEFWILELKTIHDRTEAEALKGLDLYLPKAFFETTEGEEPYLLELIDFKVILKNKVKGVIKEFMTSSAYDLIVIETKEGKYTIPWVSDFVIEVKRDEKAVIMDFPEDLLTEDFKIK